MPVGSLQKCLEHSPGRLRGLCRLKRASVRRRGLRRRWGQQRGLCTLRSLPRRPLP